MLSARKAVHVAVTVVFKVNHFKRVIDFFGDFGFRIFSHIVESPALSVGVRRAVGNGFEFQTERDVVEHVKVGEQRVFLENRVHGALMRRQIGNIFAVEKDLSAGRFFKAGNHTKRRRLATARRS